MNSEGRMARITALLESQFEKCNLLAIDWMDHAFNDPARLRDVMTVMKTGAGIAGLIARLDTSAPRNPENSGSIPQ